MSLSLILFSSFLLCISFANAIWFYFCRSEGKPGISLQSLQQLHKPNGCSPHPHSLQHSVPPPRTQPAPAQQQRKRCADASLYENASADCLALGSGTKTDLGNLVLSQTEEGPRVGFTLLLRVMSHHSAGWEFGRWAQWGWSCPTGCWSAPSGRPEKRDCFWKKINIQ